MLNRNADYRNVAVPADPLERFNTLHQRLGFKPHVEIIEEKRFKVMISVAGRQVEGTIHGEKKEAKISAVGEINPYLEGLLVAKANAVTAPAEEQGSAVEQDETMAVDGQDKSVPDAVVGAWKADDMEDILDWDLDDEVL